MIQFSMMAICIRYQLIKNIDQIIVSWGEGRRQSRFWITTLYAKPIFNVFVSFYHQVVFSLQFVVDLLSEKKSETISPPSLEEYMKSIQHTPGRIVSIRAFKQTTSRRLRKIMEKEFIDAIQELTVKGYGDIYNYRNRGTNKSILLYVKKEQIPDESIISEHDHQTKFNKTNHKTINENMLAFVNANMLNLED